MHQTLARPHTVHVHGCTLLRSYSPYDSTIVAKIGRRTQDLGSCVADFRITMIVKIRTKRLEWRKIRTWPGCARAPPPFFGPRCYCNRPVQPPHTYSLLANRTITNKNSCCGVAYEVVGAAWWLKAIKFGGAAYTPRGLYPVKYGSLTATSFSNGFTMFETNRYDHEMIQRSVTSQWEFMTAWMVTGTVTAHRGLTGHWDQHINQWKKALCIV